MLLSSDIQSVNFASFATSICIKSTGWLQLIALSTGIEQLSGVQGTSHDHMAWPAVSIGFNISSL